MSLHTNTTISINDLQIKSFEQLQVQQNLDGHHSFDIIIQQEVLKKFGSNLFDQVKGLMGKAILIHIESEDPEVKGEFDFKGVVTNILTGKSGNGINGFCTIKGHSPTILLDDDQDIEAFEEKNLSFIVNNRLKNYPKNILNSEVKPKFKDPLKFSVQYKENCWQYLKRLASNYGEWFFYDGLTLNFGSYNSKEITVSHLKDLKLFNIEMFLRPANTIFHSYEYRGDKPIEVDTKSQSLGKLNNISEHILNVSDSLYTNQGLFKVNQHISDKVQQELKHMATLQRKTKVSEMVHARGETTNLDIRVGSIVNIKEELEETIDHGKFFVTDVVHVCDGDGNYINYFTSIPSDTAMPSFNPRNLPTCESQSAIVVENNDPRGLGRIRVKFHWQEQGKSPWIRIISAAGGGDKGFYFIPEKGEEVWVDFEGGNPELPFVVGSTYNGNAKSSFGSSGNDIKAIKSRSGNIIKLNDGDGSITVSDKKGATILLKGDGTIEITAPDKILLDSKKIEIVGSEGIVLEAKTGNIEVTSGKAVAIEGKTGVEVTTKANLTLDAKANCDISGMNVSTKAKVALDLSCDLNTSVKGNVMLTLN